jgi:TolB-like protein/Tfp pilus assembly protein PilF
MRIRRDLVPSTEVITALERILGSSQFVQSDRLSKFLRFAVEQALAGNSQALKEYTIATEVYGRQSDFDPGEDSIVRSEARRLRRKLKDYYESEGREDEVVIFFQPGSYVPVTRWKTSLTGPESKSPPTVEDLSAMLDGIPVAVEMFQAPINDSVAAACAFGISDELLHRLIEVPGVRAVSQSAAQDARAMSVDASATPQIVVAGSVRIHKNLLRVTCRVSTATGLLLWSQRFDASLEGGDQLKLQEVVATALLGRISPRVSSYYRQYANGPKHVLFSLYKDVLKAEALLEEGTFSTTVSALRQFEELAVKAPEYARPHAGIAQCCVALAQKGIKFRPEFAAKGKTACQLALSLDANAIDSHSAMGCILAQEQEWEAAEESFRTALRLGDQHYAHRQFALFLLALSRFDEAWEHLSIADELDPFSARQRTAMARFFYYRRWHREAQDYFDKSMQLGKMPIEVKVMRAFVELQMGQKKIAITLAEEIQRAASDTPVYLASVAEIFAHAEEPALARSLIASAGLLNDAPISSFRKSCISLALKDNAEGVRFLTDSWRRKEPEVSWIAVDPRFDDLRQENSFQAIYRNLFKKSLKANTSSL